MVSCFNLQSSKTRVPWTARRSNQSILKEINPKYSLKGLMLKLMLQYFGHVMQDDWLENISILGKVESRRRRGQQRKDGWMASPTRWTWVWVSSRSWWWTGKSGMLQSMDCRVGQNWAIELNLKLGSFYLFHLTYSLLHKYQARLWSSIIFWLLHLSTSLE